MCLCSGTCDAVVHVMHAAMCLCSGTRRLLLTAGQGRRRARAGKSCTHN